MKVSKREYYKQYELTQEIYTYLEMIYNEIKEKQELLKIAKSPITKYMINDCIEELRKEYYIISKKFREESLLFISMYY